MAFDIRHGLFVARPTVGRYLFDVGRATLEAFKALHPRCCFCAGERPTTSRDHQPGRVFFRNKRFPDKIDVPACDVCQSASRRAEAALSLLVLPSDHSDRDFEDWQRRVSYARKHYPEFLPQVPTTTREARTIMRDMGLQRPPGMLYREVPLVLLGTDDWQDAFDIAAKKLILAQHYRCFGRPLSRTGRLYAQLTPNAHVGDGVWLDEIMQDLPNLEIGKHGSEDLGDQIATFWNASEDGTLGMFLTRVHTYFVVIGMTGETAGWRDFIDGKDGSSGPFP